MVDCPRPKIRIPKGQVDWFSADPTYPVVTFAKNKWVYDINKFNPRHTSTRGTALRAFLLGVSGAPGRGPLPLLAGRRIRMPVTVQVSAS